MLSALVAALASMAVSGTPCVDKPPCVHVTPDPEEVRAPGTVYVYRGYGWRARARVQALYGNYCPPPSGCDDVGRVTTFRADRRGRFVFRFRYGRILPRHVRRPAAAGGGMESMSFSSGRTGSDAIPRPPRSTPAQRLEARRLARLVHRTRPAVRARRRAVNRSGDRYDRTIDACQSEISRFEYDTREGEVVSALIGLTYDEHLIRPLLPALRDFADALERLELRDPDLRRGAEAWIAAVRREDRPWLRPGLCEVLRAWADTGYDLERAPVHPATAEREEFRSEIWLSDAIDDGADRLRALGGGAAAQGFLEGEMLDFGAFM